MEVERSRQNETFVTPDKSSDLVEVEDRSPMGESHDENSSEKYASSSNEDEELTHPQPPPTIDVAEKEVDNGCPEKSFDEMEANLDAFIAAEKAENEKKVKPPPAPSTAAAAAPGTKASRIAQLLQKLPGNLLQKQPTIRPNMEVDDVFAAPTSNSKQKGIQELMSRFKLHTSVQKPKKEQHFKFHISTKEEDSQGVNRVHVDEVDYVKVLSTEEQEELTSPSAAAPGVKMAEMKRKLLDEIRVRRNEKYKEKCQSHAVYAEEKDLAEKDEEEEMLLEDDISDDESDEDDDDDDEIDENKEEDLETLLNGEPDEKKKKKKKERKRLIFFEDEADESDVEGNKSMDEDEEKLDKLNKYDLSFIDDRPISDDDDEEDDDSSENKKNKEKVKNKEVETGKNMGSDPHTTDNSNKNSNPNEDSSQSQIDKEEEEDDVDGGSSGSIRSKNYFTSQGFSFEDNKSQDVVSQQSEDYFSQDMFSEFEKSVQEQKRKNEQTQSSSSTSFSSSPHPSLFDPSKTPVLLPSSLLNNLRPSPMGPWNSTLTNYQTTNSDIFRHPSSTISPFISRMSSDAALDVFCEDMNKKSSSDTPTGAASSKLSVEVAKLVGVQEPAPSSFDLDEEFENICSAKFPSQQPLTPVESQEFDPFELGSEEDDDDRELVAATDKILEQTPTAHNQSHEHEHETPRTSIKNTIGSKRLDFLMEEEEEAKQDGGDDGNEGDGDDDDDDNETVIGVKIQRKRKRCLKFSDDEDSDNEGSVNKEEEEEEVEEEDVEDEEKYNVNDEESKDKYDNGESDENSEVEYDENEEEIPKPKFKPIVSKNTGRIRAEFVEGEAELSGSEVGSGDEDEHGIDEYEDDGVDGEHFDEEKMKDQVGRMHLKQLLDDDQRHIRLLQDVYLEDGDLHTDGKGRERQFRWKNADQGTGDGLFNNENGEAMAIDDNEAEAELRRIKERNDRERWKKENPEAAKMLDGEFEDTQKFFEQSQFLRLKKSTVSKIEKETSYSEASSSISLEKSKSSSLCTSVNSVEDSVTTTFVKRGSFLQREISSISRLAEMSKINDSVAKAAKQKFVFSVVTPPPANDSSSKKKSERVKQPKKIIKVDNAAGKLQKSESQLFKWM